MLGKAETGHCKYAVKTIYIVYPNFRWVFGFYFFLRWQTYSFAFFFWLSWVFAAHRLSLVVVSRGYFVGVHGFSLVWLLLLQAQAPGTGASVAASCGLGSCGAWALVALKHEESSWTRERTFVPCIGRWILILFITGKFQFFVFKRLFLSQKVKV